jgi:hypothetical protein
MANIAARQSGEWKLTSTWNGGVVPGQNDNVNVGVFTVSIYPTDTARCYNLNFSSGGSVSVLDDAILEIYGSSTSYTTYSISANGTVKYKGSSTQFIPRQYFTYLEFSGSGLKDWSLNSGASTVYKLTCSSSVKLPTTGGSTTIQSIGSFDGSIFYTKTSGTKHTFFMPWYSSVNNVSFKDIDACATSPVIPRFFARNSVDNGGNQGIVFNYLPSLIMF